jgi:hypothetical protein
VLALTDAGDVDSPAARLAIKDQACSSLDGLDLRARSEGRKFLDHQVKERLNRIASISLSNIGIVSVETRNAALFSDSIGIRQCCVRDIHNRIGEFFQAGRVYGYNLKWFLIWTNCHLEFPCERPDRILPTDGCVKRSIDFSLWRGVI